jgi:hypothetical protein
MRAISKNKEETFKFMMVSNPAFAERLERQSDSEMSIAIVSHAD